MQPLELGVVVDQPKRDRAARRHAVITPRVDDDPVGLELLPLPPAVSALPPLELAVDRAPCRAPTPDGKPSTMAVSAGPCDSPAVKYRSMRPFCRDSLVSEEQRSARSFPRERRPVRRSNASTYLAGPGHDLLGQLRGRAGLVPARGLEPVADELLVERRLRAAGMILVAGPVARAVRREHLVDQQELAGPVVEPPLELGVGQDQPALEGVLRGLPVDLQAQRL